jgi:hypothetical protein
MYERLAAWFVTGPLGHLVSALLDLWDARKMTRRE